MPDLDLTGSDNPCSSTTTATATLPTALTCLPRPSPASAVVPLPLLPTPATQTTSTSSAPPSIPAAFSTATSTGDRLPFELRSILCQGTRARPHLYQPRGGSVPPVNA